MKHVLVTLQRFKIRAFFAWALLFIALCPADTFAVDEAGLSFKKIIILNTKASPRTESFIKGIEESCKGGFDIMIYDMNGKSKTALKHIETIKNHIKAAKNSPPFLITLGGPATLIAQKQGFETLVAFTMVGPTAKEKISDKNLIEINMSIPYKIRLSNFKALLQIKSKMTVLHDSRLSKNNRKDLLAAAQDLSLELTLIEVGSSKDIPLTMRRVKKLSQPVLFLPSKDIINRDSYQYIVRVLTENHIPSLVYSSALTRAGFLFAVEADYFTVGREYGALLCQVNHSRTKQILINYHPSVVKLTLNKKTSLLINLKHENDLVQ